MFPDYLADVQARLAPAGAGKGVAPLHTAHTQRILLKRQLTLINVTATKLFINNGVCDKIKL